MKSTKESDRIVKWFKNAGIKAHIDGGQIALIKGKKIMIITISSESGKLRYTDFETN